MLHDKKYQIFISSTFQDLKEERRAVMEEILNINHIPVGMELFQAGDDSQWNYIKRRIKECDYYILILAERFGSVGPKSKSYTRLEYEYAVANDIPVISFLLSEEARDRWPQANIEFERRPEIEAFRKLCQTRMVRYWNNVDDLRARVLTSLMEMIREKPRTGWVRSDAMASADALNEIAQLSNERRELQAQLSSLLSQQRYEPSVEVVEAAHHLRNCRASDFIIMPQNSMPEEINLLDILVILSRDMSIQAQLSTLQWSLTNKYAIDSQKYHTLKFDKAISEFSIVGVVSIGNMVEHVFDTARNYNTYELSELGKTLVRATERGAV